MSNLEKYLTKEEYKKITNKYWRLNNLYFIKDKKYSSGKIVPFKMNEAQTDYHFKKHTRNIVGKSRQHGFTTYEGIDTLDSALFSEIDGEMYSPGFDGLLISLNDEVARETFEEKIKLVFENLKLKLLPKATISIENDAANKLKFDFGDNQYSSILVAGSGRSGTYRKIHISELGKISAKYPLKADEILTGTIPAAPRDAEINIESTFEGESGLFYDMFWEAWNRGEPTSELEFKAHFYNWRWDKRDIARTTKIITLDQMEDKEFFTELVSKHQLTPIELTYYYEKYLSLNRKIPKLRQEFPTTPEEACMSSGNKLIDLDILLKQQEKEPLYVIGDWKIYSEYKAGHIYAAGADVAEGVGKDSSTCVVVDFSPKTPEVVAVYKSNKIEPDIFAYELKNGLNRYGQPLIAVERNNHGHATLSELKKIYPYSMIYGEELKDKSGNIVKKKIGWNTTGTSKPIIVFAGKKAVEDELIVLNDKGLKSELRTYEKEDISQIQYSDKQTRHWDVVMAFFICWEMRKYLDFQIGKEVIQETEDDYNEFINNEGDSMDLYSPI